MKKQMTKQIEGLEKKIVAKGARREKKNKPIMKVSGVSVKNLGKIIEKKGK